MLESTILWQQIQQFNKTLRLHNLIALALLLGLGAFQYRYLRNCLLGPQKIDSAQLLKVTDPSSLERDYVTFTSPKALDTGYQKVSKRRSSETTTNKYAIALVGTQKALLVEAQPNDDLKNPTFTGTLSTIDSSVQSNVVDSLQKEEPMLNGRLLPVILETGDYRTAAYVLVPLLIGGIALTSWNLYQAQIRSADPRKHPVYKSLAKYGESDSLATEIDRELKTTHQVDTLKSGMTYVTPHWVVHPQTYDLHMTQLDKLVWLYKKVTKHSVNFIPTGKSYELILHDNLGRQHTLKMPEHQLDDTIAQVNRHAPWAVVGFTDEIKAMWDKHRDDFYQLVAERKQEAST